MKKELIIFSQASADIQYVLYLYEKYNKKYNITIYVVNKKNNFNFFKLLNLSANIEYIPLVAKKNILKFLFFIFELQIIHRRSFSKTKDAKIYFFSDYYDYVTPFFIERLKEQNQIYFMDLYKIKEPDIGGLIVTLQKLIVSLILGYKIEFFNFNGMKIYRYKYDKNIVQNKILQIESNSLTKFYVDIELINNNKKNLLFFESSKDKQIFKNYVSDLENLIKKLTKTYNVYIKPHPSNGYTEILKKLDVEIIQDCVPSELLNIKKFDILGGIISASVGTIDHINKYSFMKLFTPNDNVQIESYEKYLNNLSNSIIFVENINDIV